MITLQTSPSCELMGNRNLEQIAEYQQPHVVRQILKSSQTIAIVGLSTNPDKDSHMVARFLQNAGFRVIPVHPKADCILGEKVYRSVADIAEPVDIVNVFRPSHECVVYAEQAVIISARALWLQLNIVNEEAAGIARAGGLAVIMHLCLKIEYRRHLDAQNSPEQA